MNDTLKLVIYTVLGVVIAVAFGMVGSKIGHAIHPPPDGFDVTDPNAIAEYIRSGPVGARMVVALAHALGTLVGALFTARMTKGNRIGISVVSGFILLATAVNQFANPFPMWFTVVDIVGVVVAAGIVMKLAHRFREQA